MSVAEMVDRQVRKWDTASRVGDRRQRPIITVSREYGALGADLGRAIAEKMGFDFWDRDLVHHMASDKGVTDRLVKTFDEHPRGPLYHVFSGLLAQETGFSEEDYYIQLIKVIRAIAHHGAAVVVGRGVNYVVGPRFALRLRVVAPLEQRVQRIVMRDGVTEDQARYAIEQTDRERTKFVEQHFSRRIAEPTDYDLILNSGTMPREHLVDLVQAAYAAKFGTTPAVAR